MVLLAFATVCRAQTGVPPPPPDQPGQVCLAETEACMSNEACTLAFQDLESNPAGCQADSLCNAFMSCTVASTMQDEPCGVEFIACFEDAECGAFTMVPEGQEVDAEACAANSLCNAFMQCQSETMSGGQSGDGGGGPADRCPDEYQACLDAEACAALVGDGSETPDDAACAADAQCAAVMACMGGGGDGGFAGGSCSEWPGPCSVGELTKEDHLLCGTYQLCI